MSVLGGRAAGIAAVTGCGSGLLDRFPTLDKQLDRIKQLEAQMDFFVRKRMTKDAQGVQVQIDEVRALSAPPRAAKGKPRS